jgi:DHA1 family multidrug resistance protein-like MFS transporter
MARFLFCSFALVLLYPSGIDMYLVGLPHIARDLGASEAQLHIAFSAYLAGMASSMVFAGRIADKAGRQPVAITGAVIFALASVLCSMAQDSTVPGRALYSGHWRWRLLRGGLCHSARYLKPSDAPKCSQC